MIVRTQSILGSLTALGMLAAPVCAWPGTLSIGPSEFSMASADTIAADGLSVPMQSLPVPLSGAGPTLDDGAGSPVAATSTDSAPQAVASADAGSAPPPAPQESGLVQALSFLLQRAGR